VLNVTHEAGLVAVQLHVAPAVTAIVPVADAAPTDALAGEMLYPHPAACVTVTACPATVSTPDLREVVGFAVKEYDTVPDPVPLAPVVIVIHETALLAVHVHPAWVVTDTLPVPAVAAAVAAVGATV
jgi:hypothetical protein